MSGPQGFVYPVVGDSIDVWGLALNTLLGLSETHNHTVGRGNPIPSAALGIDADTSWAGYALKLAKAITFTEQTAAAMTSYASALFVESTSHNLYFRNSGGTNVQITAGNQLNLSAVGGIGGDYASVSALFSYDDATRRYLAQQELSGGLRPWAGIAMGPADLYQPAVSIVNRVRLQSPNALAASYAVTWLAALPSVASMLTIDNTGQLKTDGVLGTNANITLQGTGHVLRGTRSTTVPLLPGTVSHISGGGVTTPGGGFWGVGVPASSVNMFPIQVTDENNQLCLITSVTVYCSVTIATCTLTLSVADTATGGATDITGATVVVPAGGTQGVLTPSTPLDVTLFGVGACLMVKFAPASTTVTIAYSAKINSTIVT